MKIAVVSSIAIDPQLLRRISEEFKKDTGEDLEIGVIVDPSDASMIAADGVAILRLDPREVPSLPMPSISPEIPYVREKQKFPRAPRFLGKGKAGKGGGRYR